MRPLLLAFIGMLLLVACSPHDPVRIHRADVEVGETHISVGDGHYRGDGHYHESEQHHEDDNHHHQDQGNFCPPGQGKKGRC